MVGVKASKTMSAAAIAHSDTYDPKGYPPEVKEHCLKLYFNGMGFSGIERATGVHNTVINWVRLAAQALPELEN